jgi:hypothetical protein
VLNEQHQLYYYYVTYYYATSSNNAATIQVTADVADIAFTVLTVVAGDRTTKVSPAGISIEPTAVKDAAASRLIKTELSLSVFCINKNLILSPVAIAVCPVLNLYY